MTSTRPLLGLLTPLGLLWALSVPLSAQVPGEDSLEPSPAPSGAGSLSGTIYDREGPVAGARVELSAPDDTLLETSTDEKGRYRLLRLDPGRWQIAVTSPGHLPSDGFVVVVPGDDPVLDVELRGLDEGTPGFAESGSEGTIRRWLERGNALLDQGRATEARTEYEKALPLLPAERRAEVLRAVARTYYVEQQPQAAADALWQSVELHPGSAEGRQLYLGVMANLGRQREAEQNLERLDAEGPTPADPAPPERPGRSASPPPPLLEAESPLPHRVGTFAVRFDRRNDLGRVAEVERRYGLPEALAGTASDYAPQDEQFSVFVPESYRRDESRPEEPWGLFVWVSPTARGGLGRQENLALLDERRLIWIGADRAGNPRPFWDRLGLALDAAQEMRRYYDIDPDRIYVGGYSGGGRMAAALALLWPEVFRGGVSWFGTSWWAPVPVPYKPGHSWPAAFERPDRKTVMRLRERGRLSLVTGDLDFNRSETHQVYRLMREEGIDGAAYFQIPEADHYFGVDSVWLGKALAHLDGD